MSIPRISLGLLMFPALAAALLAGTSPARAADSHGSVTGQFVFDGEVPEKKVLIKKGDAAIRDSAVCAADTRYDEDLVVDAETKGIANIFIFMDFRDAARLDIPDELKESKEKEIVFDQKGCMFTPRALLVRTDQTVLLKSDDPIAHNTHTHMLSNDDINILIPPKEREGVPVRKPNPERLPMPVTCDIHTWMKANWLVVDHPYAAVTDAEGRFTIEGLPAGKHTFRVWHEKGLYIDRSYEITVEAGQETKLDAVKVPAARFDR